MNLSENGLHYSWDWAGVHFVALGIVVGDAPEVTRKRRYAPLGSLPFLQQDLEKHVGKSGRPVVLVHHVDVHRYSDEVPDEKVRNNESQAFMQIQISATELRVREFATNDGWNPDTTFPALAPAEAIKTIEIPKGYRLECLASEPMVEEPATFQIKDENYHIAIDEAAAVDKSSRAQAALRTNHRTTAFWMEAA